MSGRYLDSSLQMCTPQPLKSTKLQKSYPLLNVQKFADLQLHKKFAVEVVFSLTCFYSSQSEMLESFFDGVDCWLLLLVCLSP